MKVGALLMLGDKMFDRLRMIRILEGKRALSSDMVIVGLSEAFDPEAREAFEARACEAWERMRMAILECGLAAEWERLFAEACRAGLGVLAASPYAPRLQQLLGLSDEMMVAYLSFSGAVGEALVWPDDYQTRFANRVVEVFSAGYWPCGWRDGKFLVCGEC